MKSARLLSLLLILQTRERIPVPELAERLEVSERTILRDVDALGTAGVPVYAERGRHGGIVLLPGSRINVSHLDPAEQEALALTGLDDAQLQMLGLSAAHTVARQKLAARRASGSSGSASRSSSIPLADLIVVDNSGWLAPDERGADVAELALTLRRGRRLSIRYRRSGAREATTRVVDPYGLASKSGRWYLVADADGRGRLFSLERLDGFEALPDPSRTRVGESLRSVWAAAMRRTEAPGDVFVEARLRGSRVDLARRILGSRLVAVGARDDDGWCPVRVAYDDVEAVRQLLQFGDHIEVESPADARLRFAELAADLARRHAPPRP